MSEHHKMFPPSAANRWMVCTGSVLPVSELPEVDNGNFYSAEGTVAHKLMEQRLRNSGAGPWDVGTKVTEQGHDIVVTPEMSDYVDECLAYVDKYASPGSVVLSEVLVTSAERVQSVLEGSRKVAQPSGTVDVVVYNPKAEPATLHVFDLKYGKGVRVVAQGNRQLTLYGIYALDTFSWLFDCPITSVHLHIMQPRMPDGFTVCELTQTDLDDFAGAAYAAMQEALRGEGRFVPGEAQCQWCPLSGNCEAQLKEMYDAFGDLAPGQQVENDWVRLDEADLAEALGRAPFVEQTLAAVRKEAVRRLGVGESVPGYKLVASATHRKWTAAEPVVEKFLRAIGVEDPFTHKLMSPAQAEKALGKRVKTTSLPDTYKPPGKPALAPASDPRPEYQPASIDEFEELS